MKEGGKKKEKKKVKIGRGRDNYNSIREDYINNSIEAERETPES